MQPDTLKVKRLFYVAVAFIVVEAVLYTSFVIIDLAGGSSDLSSHLKYSGILLCLCMAVTYASMNRTRIAMLIAMGIMFTAISDYYLLFGTDYLPGLLSFSIVQTVYFMAITEWKKISDSNSTGGSNSFRDSNSTGGSKYTKTAKSTGIYAVIMLRLAAALIIGAALRFVAGDSKLLVTVAAFYAVSFASNIVRAWRTKEVYRMFAVALVVFALCDVNVLLYNLPDYVEISSRLLLFLLKFAGDSMWIFYLPSQVMLTLCTLWRKGDGLVIMPRKQ